MHEVQRPLLTPDECLRLPGPQKNDRDLITAAGDMVVYCAGFPAIYFEDQTSQLAPRFRHQSTATRCRISMYPRFRLFKSLALHAIRRELGALFANVNAGVKIR